MKNTSNIAGSKKMTEEEVEKLGRKMTIVGPPSPPEGGDILSDPELLWCNDELDEFELGRRRCEAEDRILQQGPPVSQHWYKEYTGVGKASRHWTNFYKRNGNRFYKDRHYLHAEFPELLWQEPVYLSGSASSSPGISLLEVGCGVGNAVIPLIELNPALRVTAVDFAPSAIEILSRHPFAVTGAVKQEGKDDSAPPRLVCRVCDIVSQPLPVPAASQDLILCLFALSSIAPEHHPCIASKLAAALKPGGLLLFRDYGRYDEAQLRFRKGSRLGDNFYVRNDGTCAYYFDLNELDELFVGAGGGGGEEIEGIRMEAVSGRCVYIRRQMANRSQGRSRKRVWVQAVYRKAIGGRLADSENSVCGATIHSGQLVGTPRADVPSLSRDFRAATDDQALTNLG